MNELKFKKYKMSLGTIVSSIALSLKGDMLAVGQQSDSDTAPCVTFWRITDSGLEETGHGICFEYAYTPDHLNFCDHDRFLVLSPNKVYSISERKFKSNFVKYGQVVNIKASRDFPSVLVSGDEIRLIDISNKTIWAYEGKVLLNSLGTPVVTAQASDDFNTVFIAGNNELITVNTDNGRIIKKMNDGPAEAGKICLSKNMRYICMYGYPSRDLHVWDYESGEKILTLSDDPSKAVCFIYDRYLINGGASGAIGIYDFNLKNYCSFTDVHDFTVTDIKVDYERKQLITASEDGCVSLTDFRELV